MTLLQFGLGLITTPTSEKAAPKSHLTGTDPLSFYKLSPAPAALSVSDMFAQLELTDSRAAAATEAGTKWVAQTFFSEHPTTLATLRMRAGLSQRELGNRLEVSQPQIAKWERGDAPNMQLKTVHKLAYALSIDLTELVSILISANGNIRHEH